MSAKNSFRISSLACFSATHVLSTRSQHILCKPGARRLRRLDLLGSLYAPFELLLENSV